MDHSGRRTPPDASMCSCDHGPWSSGPPAAHLGFLVTRSDLVGSSWGLLELVCRGFSGSAVARLGLLGLVPACRGSYAPLVVRSDLLMRIRCPQGLLKLCCTSWNLLWLIWASWSPFGLPRAGSFGPPVSHSGLLELIRTCSGHIRASWGSFGHPAARSSLLGPIRARCDSFGPRGAHFGLLVARSNLLGLIRAPWSGSLWPPWANPCLPGLVRAACSSFASLGVHSGLLGLVRAACGSFGPTVTRGFLLRLLRIC